MRARNLRLLAVGAVALAGLLVTMGVAFAGTITSPTGNPFVVPGNAQGNPALFTITGSGYPVGTLVYAEQCDGVSPSAVNWSPLEHCDLGTSPAPVVPAPDGSVAFNASDSNHVLHVFKGESPQSLFNCLSPNGTSVGNGLPDFRNCQIRVSTNNNAVTTDQAFLTIQLPEAVQATTTTSTSTTTTIAPTTTTTVPSTSKPAGSCTGAQALAKIVGTDPANAGLTDQSHRVTESAALLTDLASKTKIGGSCTGLLEPADNSGGSTPATLHPKSFSFKLSGIGSCAAGAGKAVDATASSAFTLSGKLTITMTETDSAGKAFQIQAYITVKGTDPAKSDVLEITGVITKGPSLGATVSGELYFDPVTKITPAVHTGNGYQVDLGSVTHCGDGVANNASILTAQVGDGTSPEGTTGVPGLSFSYPPAS